MPGLGLELKVQSESAEGTSLAQLQKPQVSVQCLKRIARADMSPFGSTSTVCAVRRALSVGTAATVYSGSVEAVPFDI